jgi:hypothetical protein
MVPKWIDALSEEFRHDETRGAARTSRVREDAKVM